MMMMMMRANILWNSFTKPSKLKTSSSLLSPFFYWDGSKVKRNFSLLLRPGITNTTTNNKQYHQFQTTSRLQAAANAKLFASQQPLRLNSNNSGRTDDELPFTYSIHFPDTGGTNEKEPHSCEVVVHRESQAGNDHLSPVVLLLGWAGCQQKHLRKYAAIYEQKGYITMTVIVPVLTVFVRAYKMSEVARGVLSVMAENDLLPATGGNRRPVLFHVFSNGGGMLYSQLSELLHGAATADSVGHHHHHHHGPLPGPSAVRGVVFDSSPGKLRLLLKVRAFMNTPAQVQQVFFLRYPSGLCLLTYLLVLRGLRVLLLLLPLPMQVSTGVLPMEIAFQMYESVRLDRAACPQLFLYSKKDRMIRDRDVEEVMAARKARGVEVRGMCWEDSQHVAHLPAHPEEYAKACLDFAEACVVGHGSGKDRVISV